MIMQPASKLRLLKMRGNVLIRHLLHPCLQEVVLLLTVSDHIDDSYGSEAHLFLGPGAIATGSDFARPRSDSGHTAMPVKAGLMMHFGIE
jgi:hypothetical protein